MKTNEVRRLLLEIAENKNIYCYTAFLSMFRESKCFWKQDTTHTYDDTFHPHNTAQKEKPQVRALNL